MKFFFVFIFIMISISSSKAMTNEKLYSVVEIETAYTEVYDDGIIRKYFHGFELLDSAMKTIITTFGQYDEPVKIKIPYGEYFIRYLDKDNKVKLISLVIDSSVLRKVNCEE